MRTFTRLTFQPLDDLFQLAQRRNKRLQLTKLLICTLTLVGTISVSSAAMAAESGNDVRATLFADASSALKSANAARASLLAPTGYAEASERYKKAEELLADGASLDAIRKNLRRASEGFTQASKAANLASQQLSLIHI